MNDDEALLILQLRELLPFGATVGRYGARIRVTLRRPVRSYLDVGEATAYVHWLRAGNMGSFQEMTEPAAETSGKDLAAISLRMHAALARIRGLCMARTGRKDAEDRFVSDKFAELIGRIAGEGMTGCKGGE